MSRVSPQHLAWSPDGNSLAYDSGTSIWRVDLATGTPVRLTTDDPSQGIESWQPSWSPDGKTIAYSRFQTCFRCTAIWLIDSNGASPRQIYDTFQARRPTFSPDGTKLALSLANDLVIGLDGLPILAGGGAYTIWSPRGTYVAYTGGGLWIRNLQTGTYGGSPNASARKSPGQRTGRGSPGARVGRSPSFGRGTGHTSRSSQLRTSAAAPQASRRA